MTECSRAKLSFQGLTGRRVEGSFSGGKLSSDGGAIMLREVAGRTGFFEQVANCFNDERTKHLIRHPLLDLLKQRIYGLVCGYEDLNDHDEVRKDPMFQLCLDRVPSAEDFLAGHSTLNRIELSPAKKKEQQQQGDQQQQAEAPQTSPEKNRRDCRIHLDDEKMKSVFVDMFINFTQKQKDRPKEFIIDFDATDIPLHGEQEGRHYHGYYRGYCYLPLYAFCGDFPLWAELRSSDGDAARGTDEALAFLVPKLRAAFPDIPIIVRADGGFTREYILKHCEDNGLDYIFGLPQNSRLNTVIEPELELAKKKHEETGKAARVFRDFSYQTLDSWSRARRVVGKAEWLNKGQNPRFVVTSLSAEQYSAATLYEKLYCMRGDMENRIKEQLQLFAGRTSCQQKRANQMRLWFSTLSYTLLLLTREILLQGTAFASAEPATIRTRIIKVAVEVKITARRILLAFAEHFPLKEMYLKIFPAPMLPT